MLMKCGAEAYLAFSMADCMQGTLCPHYETFFLVEGMSKLFVATALMIAIRKVIKRNRLKVSIEPNCEIHFVERVNIQVVLG